MGGSTAAAGCSAPACPGAGLGAPCLLALALTAATVSTAPVAAVGELEVTATAVRLTLRNGSVTAASADSASATATIRLEETPLLTRSVEIDLSHLVSVEMDVLPDSEAIQAQADRSRATARPDHARADVPQEL